LAADVVALPSATTQVQSLADAPFFDGILLFLYGNHCDDSKPSD